MKESRFIELLNLYVDQQISSEETAELETEISRSPAHYRTYLQYCRMQRACVMLFENFQPPAAPLAEDLQRADSKVMAFPGDGFRLSRAAGAAGLAVAAACVALVLFNRTTPPAALPFVAAKPDTVQVSVPPESFHAVAIDVPTRQPEFRTVFTARRSAINRFPANSQEAAFDWMNQIELSPMSSLSDRPVVFTVPAQPASSDLRFRQGRGQEKPAVEMTAFEFQQ